MALTKIKTGSVSDSITLTTPDINTPDIDGGTIDGTVIGGAIPAAISGTTITATVANANPKLKAAYNATNYMGISHEKINVQGGGVGLIIQGNGVDRATFASGGGLNLANGDLVVASGNVGIGVTPSSGVRLDVRSNASATIGDFRNASATGFGLYVAAGDTSAHYAFRAADYQNNALFSVMGDGNVGIGTSSPDTLVHAYKASNAILKVEEANGYASLQQSGVNSYLNNIASGGSLIFRNGTGGTERMRISPTGSMISSMAGGVFLKNSSGGTSATQILVSNTGGSMRAGVESSSGNTIQSGTSAYAAVFGNQGNYPTQFTTNGTVRATIDAAGALILGHTGVPNGTQDAIYLVGSSGERRSSRSNTNARYHLVFYNPNGEVGHIETSGSATNYVTSSDYRLKENVVPMTGSIDRVKALKPSRFNFIADADKTVDGFLAHEAAEVVAESVTGTKDAMKDEEYEVTAAVEEVRDEDDNITTEAADAVMGTRSVPDMQGIDQSKLVPLLVAALQEAIARIETLEARITALEGE